MELKIGMNVIDYRGRPAVVKEIYQEGVILGYDDEFAIYADLRIAAEPPEDAPSHPDADK